MLSLSLSPITQQMDLCPPLGFHGQTPGKLPTPTSIGRHTGGSDVAAEQGFHPDGVGCTMPPICWLPTAWSQLHPITGRQPPPGQPIDSTDKI